MGSTHDLRVAHASQAQKEAVEAVLGSASFARNPRLSKLLQYLCDRSFAGESGLLKEYTVATDVFDRGLDFDQSTDAIVRVEMHRLRKKLKEFYAGEGQNQHLEIVIQSGQYAPEFVERSAPLPVIALPKDPVPLPPPEKPRKSTSPFWWASAAVLAVAGSALFIAHRSQAKVSAPPAVQMQPAGLAEGAVRILCGRSSGRFRDREGNEWGPDAFFTGGTPLQPVNGPIYRTRNGFVYEGGREGDFSYKIPLRPGTYELHLFFADTSFTPGMSMEGGENTRFFNINLNGAVLVRDLDIIASAGPSTAYERVFKDVQPDKDGFVHLNFMRTVGTPLLNAIEILPSTLHRMRPVRISTQDSGFTDRSGLNWQPDDYFLYGRAIAKYGIVAGDVDSQIFERERYGNFSYAIPAAPGTYELKLYFAETYFGPTVQGGGGVGARLFDVYCNGAALLTNFDVYREAGTAHQLIKTFHDIQPNAQGNILLSFVPRKNYAMVSAIELIDETRE